MHTQHHDTCRAAARTTYRGLFAAGAVALALGLANSAHAALIGVSLSYDGSVYAAPSAGVEAHDLAPIFPANPAIVPVTNGALPAPLLPARTLGATLTEFLDSIMMMSVQHVVITLNGQGGGTDNAFVNPLDPAIPYPAQFDASFHSNSLPANQMIMPAWIGIEDGNDASPFPAPGTATISGLGTQANPWRVQLGLSANQVTFHSNGWVKIHLYYKFGALVPEPTSGILLLLGLIGFTTSAARRRR